MSQVQASPTRTRQVRVIIADDIQATRHSTSLMLNLLPETELVGTATNGVEAIQLVKQHRPDLLILDVNMPKMDGISALSEIRRLYPEVKCVVISSERDEVVLARAKKAGAFHFLVKPFTSEELVEVVTRIIQTQENRNGRPVTGQLRDRRDVHLRQLASTYAKMHRTDDEALAVFEELAENPYCEEYWLKSLAMIYVIRMKWSKLKALAARLEE
ncbi:MAG: response regulator [Anaerolineaceae bacterium]|nr:response regulator [Anaerolineaceae bacterium]